MEKFIQYLSDKRIGNPKQRSFYAQWVGNLYRFVKKSPGQHIDDDEIKGFLSFLKDTHHDWQVQQAKDAIRLYFYFRGRVGTTSKDVSSGIEKLGSHR